jgi:hypothetical protein
VYVCVLESRQQSPARQVHDLTPGPGQVAKVAVAIQADPDDAAIADRYRAGRRAAAGAIGTGLYQPPAPRVRGVDGTAGEQQVSHS